MAPADLPFNRGFFEKFFNELRTLRADANMAGFGRARGGQEHLAKMNNLSDAINRIRGELRGAIGPRGAEHPYVNADLVALIDPPPAEIAQDYIGIANNLITALQGQIRKMVADQVGGSFLKKWRRNKSNKNKSRRMTKKTRRYRASLV